MQAAIAMVVLVVGFAAAPSPAAANHNPPSCTVGGFAGQPPWGSYICEYGVTKIVWPDGRKEWFVVGTDWQHQVWHSYQYSAGGSWSSWQGLDGSAESSVLVLKLVSGRIDISVYGTNGQFYCKSWEPLRGWNGWDNASCPQDTWSRYRTMIQWPDGHFEEFEANPSDNGDNYVWHRYERSDGSWSPWYSLGAPDLGVVSPVYVRHLDPGKIILSVRDLGSRYVCLQGGPSGWQSTWTTSACPKNI